MRRIVAAGATDPGRVREGNEDALLMRDSVFAVADGMGGHLAGEVASATALEPIAELDGRVFADAPAALAALRDAVVAANDRVSRLADDNPAYRGMGTTLTAALVEGRRLHVAHVGDSRAYLLRGGDFSQLTDDHTFVQHLIDEGQITREEASRHPKRSVITRAIGVSREVDVDSMSLELQPGDQLLICSDGLTGVVEDDAIAQELTTGADPDRTVQALIGRANAGGGPDNITVVLLRYEDPAATDGEVRAPIRISSRQDRTDTDWAGQLGAYGGDRVGATMTTDPGGISSGRVLGRAVAIVLAIALLVALVWGGGAFLLSRSYYLGVDGDEVVIYQGIDRSIGSLQLSRVAERSGITLDQVPTFQHATLQRGRAAANLSDARRLLATIPTNEPTDDGPGTGTGGESEGGAGDAGDAGTTTGETTTEGGA